MPQGNSNKPDPGYNTKIGDDGYKPTGTAPCDDGPMGSGVVCRTDLDTNRDIGRGYGEITGKGKRD